MPKLPRSAKASAVLPRKDVLSEGDGTSLRVNGGNDAKKDRRFASAAAPTKEAQPNFNFSFGQTGTTGRS